MTIKRSDMGICARTLGPLAAAAFLLAPNLAWPGWEVGAKGGYQSNVSRAVGESQGDGYASAHVTYQREPEGETRTDWTASVRAEGVAYAELSDLGYGALTASPGLIWVPKAGWTIGASLFFQAKVVADSDQSAVAAGGKFWLRQSLGGSGYVGEYYAYTDSRAREEAYSFAEHALGAYAGVGWTTLFWTELGYEYGHGDSFQSLNESSDSSDSSGAANARGKGRHRVQSSTFDAEVARDVVDRHTVSLDLGLDWSSSLTYQAGYAFTAAQGDLGSYTSHAVYLGAAYRL